MMRYTLVVAVLLVASFALAEQADPGAPSGAPGIVMSDGVVTCGSMKLQVQKVLHPRPLGFAEESAIIAYMAGHGDYLLHSGNYSATEKSIRLLLGIEQSHLPLTRKPAEYLSDAQIVWQMLLYLETYVRVPWPALGPCPQPQYKQPVGWQPKSNSVSPATKDAPTCTMPSYHQTAGNGPMGGENHVSVQRIVPDLTPALWILMLRHLQRERCERQQQCEGDPPPKPDPDDIGDGGDGTDTGHGDPPSANGDDGNNPGTPDTPGQGGGSPPPDGSDGGAHPAGPDGPPAQPPL